MPAPKILTTYNVKLLTAGWSPISNEFYPIAVLEEIANQFKPGLGNFDFDGGETSLRFNLDDVSHRTNRLYIRDSGRELWGEIQTLDTTYGRLVDDLYKTGNILFKIVVIGKTNRFDEMEPGNIQYLRVSTYGVYK